MYDNQDYTSLPTYMSSIVPNSGLHNQSIFNVIFMTITGVIVSSCITTLPSLIIIISNYFWKIVNNISEIYYGQDNQVIVTSTYLKNTHGIVENRSIDYDAIVFRLNKKGINTKKVKNKVSGNQNSDIFRFAATTKQDNMSIADYNIIYEDVITLSEKNDIRIRCNVTNSSLYFSNKNSDDIVINYDIHICSKKLIVSEIIDKINKWKIQYINYKKIYTSNGTIYHYTFFKNSMNALPKMKSTQAIYAIGSDDSCNGISDNTTPSISWVKNSLNSTKGFNNIFFTDKDQLMERLHFFLNNQSEYLRKGTPYTLGLLFHGEPGCGKTSCIKALSNYTKRHIVEINLKNIKTCSEFINIFHNEFINNDYIPIDKRIIVLEDIDCMIDIVKQRNDNQNDQSLNLTQIINNSEMTTDDMYKLSIIKNINNNNKNIDDELTLSCILNTIDGILEQNGRILVITTNYPDKLDSALLRPGRIDVKIKFTRCTNKMTRDLIEHFYNTKLSNDLIFDDDKYTPAEIIDRCFNNSKDIESIISYYRTKSTIN